MASTVKIGGGHTNWYPGVPVRWMTMVRNPLKRFQSMLMFRKRRAPDMELYRGDINEFVKYRLADVEQYDFEWHRNMMTRMLGGDLDTARANLRKFALVGVTNRWLTFWNKAADMADVPRPQREYKTNCSSNYDAIRDMTPRTKQIIIDHNRDDFALYEEAVRLS